MTTLRAPLCLLALGFPLFATTAEAQPTRADYERALGLRERYEALVTGTPDAATWIDDTHRFWYRRSVTDGTEFVVIDVATREKRAAFDHALLAAELAREISPTATAHRLSFTTFRFVSEGRAIEFQVEQRRVRFHGDFYKAAVSYAGCHDNRMDKIWWNEQWMGWPLGPQYSRSSNVDNAAKLQGQLLLVVRELDTNVDPA